MKLSIVIPVYNEVKTIEEVLRRVREAPLGSPDLEREVMLVDDGSTDGTSALLDRLNHDGALRVHHLERNQGKGVAVRTGLQMCTGDIMLIQDADLEYDPADYPVLLQPILEGRCKVVYGSRFLGRMESMDPWHAFGNRILSLVSTLLFFTRVTDAYTCYKVFSRDVAQKFQLRSHGFELEAELTAKILKSGYRMVEVPIRFKGRTTAEGKKIRKLDGFLGVLNLIKYRFLD